VLIFFQDTSTEYQQAEGLWDMFCCLKTKLISEALGDPEGAPHPTEDSLLGSGDGEAALEEFTDGDDETRNSFDEVNDSRSSTVPPAFRDAAPLRIPILKLKMSGSGGMVDSAGCFESIKSTADASSDFDMTSENQSFTTTTQHSLMSSSSEQDELNSEVYYICYRCVSFCMMFSKLLTLCMILPKLFDAFLFESIACACYAIFHISTH